MLASAGVLTVLIAVGLVPRFAGETHSANEVLVYENLIILGTIIGSFLSVFHKYVKLGQVVANQLPEYWGYWSMIANIILAIFGIFSGMFVGCLALAIAEMLNSIPILARRIGFRHGLGIAVTCMAIGKLCGSLFYFYQGLYRTM